MRYAKNWLTEDELRRIFELPDLPEKYEIWIKLLYYPALRVSEAINVRVKDVDVEKQKIIIWGGKRKHVTEAQEAYCPMKICRDFKRYAEHNDLRPSDYIMFSNKQKQVTRQHVNHVLQQLANKAGINKKVSSHTLRRSRAEHVLDKGLPLHQVKRLLRHKNINTTMQYLDICIADVRSAMEKIDDVIF